MMFCKRKSDIWSNQDMKFKLNLGKKKNPTPSIRIAPVPVKSVSLYCHTSNQIFYTRQNPLVLVLRIADRRMFLWQEWQQTHVISQIIREALTANSYHSYHRTLSLPIYNTKYRLVEIFRNFTKISKACCATKQAITVPFMQVYGVLDLCYYVIQEFSFVAFWENPLGETEIKPVRRDDVRGHKASSIKTWSPTSHLAQSRAKHDTSVFASLLTTQLSFSCPVLTLVSKCTCIHLSAHGHVGQAHLCYHEAAEKHLHDCSTKTSREVNGAVFHSYFM